MPDALFYGSGTALITPFAGGEVDYGAWRRLIEFQLESGTDALIVLGSTGEAPTVTYEERQRLASMALGIARGRAPVILSVGSNCTRMAEELAANARELGADGVLLSAPYYNKPGTPGIREHFFRVADAAGIPVIAYNVPGRTGVNIAPELMAQLARHPLIRGLKEASADATHISRMMSALADGIAIYSGNDSQTLNIMAQGGRGVISVAGNIIPREMAALTHAMLREDLESARKAYGRVAGLIDALSLETNPGPIKYAMSVRGMCEETLRLPLYPAAAETRGRIRAALEDTCDNNC